MNKARRAGQLPKPGTGRRRGPVSDEREMASGAVSGKERTTAACVWARAKSHAATREPSPQEALHGVGLGEKTSLPLRRTKDQGRNETKRQKKK